MLTFELTPEIRFALSEAWRNLRSLSSLEVRVYIEALYQHSIKGITGEVVWRLPIAFRHGDVTFEVSQESFRKARKGLCAAGLMRQCRHSKTNKPLRDYFILCKPEENPTADYCVEGDTHDAS